MTKTALAKALGISREMVHRLVNLGMPCTTVKAAREWRKANLQQPAAEDDTIAGQTKRLRAAQADLAELEAAEQRGELSPTDEMQNAWSEAFVQLRTQTEAIAGRCAAQLSVMTDPAEIRAYLLNEIRASLASSAARLEDWARGVWGDSVAQTPAKPNGGRMGGPMPDSAAGES